MARILIADDDTDYLTAFQEAMTALGHSAIGVSSGDEVVPVLRDTPVDIVFLDMVMSGGGAMTTLHAINALAPDLPVVVITGRAELLESPLMREGMRLAAAKLHKTTPLAELERTIRQLTR